MRLPRRVADDDLRSASRQIGSGGNLAGVPLMACSDGPQAQVCRQRDTSEPGRRRCDTVRAMTVDRRGIAQRPALLTALILGAVLLVGVLALFGWLLLLRGTEPYPGLNALERDDPQGAAACQLLAEWRDGQVTDDAGQLENEALISITAAEHAAQSQTPTIRVLAGEEELGMRFIDLDRLDAACAAAGVEMP